MSEGRDRKVQNRALAENNFAYSSALHSITTGPFVFFRRLPGAAQQIFKVRKTLDFARAKITPGSKSKLACSCANAAR